MRMQLNWVVMSLTTIVMSGAPSVTCAQPVTWQSMAPCLAGPDQAPASGCDSNDLSGDARVSVRDLLPLQVAQNATGGTGPCDPPTDNRWYVGATVPQPYLTGTRALIEYRRALLCDEPTSQVQAFIAVWTGVTDTRFGTNPEDLRWAQTGYTIHRSAFVPGTQVFVQNYQEIRGGPQPDQYLMHYSPAPFSGAREYTCSLYLPSSGIWEFTYDGEVLLYGSVPGWEGQTGTRADYLVELLNWGNQVPGTETSKSRFDQCAASIFSADFEAVTIIDQNLFNTFPTEYGVERVGSQRINVWDRNP